MEEEGTDIDSYLIYLTISHSAAYSIATLHMVSCQASWSALGVKLRNAAYIRQPDSEKDELDGAKMESIECVTSAKR